MNEGDLIGGNTVIRAMKSYGPVVQSDMVVVSAFR